MIVQVDGIHQEVRDGERNWPFSIDWHRNTVSITLGESNYRLRPLRWGEKRNLARFAHLGESFLALTFVRMCLDPEADLPQAGDDLQALKALAEWINYPNAAKPALPLDEILLSRVAFTVSAEFGWLPPDIDGLSAFEIELLWRGAEEQPTVVSERSAGSPLLGIKQRRATHWRTA